MQHVRWSCLQRSKWLQSPIRNPRSEFSQYQTIPAQRERASGEKTRPHHQLHSSPAMSEAALYSALRPRIKALLVDAAGTLISPSEPVAEVYWRYAQPYGCQLTQEQILQNFRRAFNEPWKLNSVSHLRYDGEAKEFWRQITRLSTGCDDEQMHAALYTHFAEASAWKITDGAIDSLQQLKASGIKLAVVSNFDTRLRAILQKLGLLSLFDSVIISAEVKAEKPNPVIFEQACAQLGVSPSQSLVLGDDRRNDISGGRDAGCYAWLYGIDVLSFKEAAERLLNGQID